MPPKKTIWKLDRHSAAKHYLLRRYLQAWLRFCAGFGARGVFNFADLGRTDPVVDPEARARDRAMAASGESSPESMRRWPLTILQDRWRMISCQKSPQRHFRQLFWLMGAPGD